MRILVVEDDPRMARLLERILQEAGHGADTAVDGAKALECASMTTYDLILLDIMLPVLDGLAVCRSLRARNSSTPILMLSARSELRDRIQGLHDGADDYMAKPFAVEELRARVGALLRRRSLPAVIALTVGGIRIDRRRRLVEVRGHTIELTVKEYALLEFLLLNRSRVVTREEIATHVWDERFDPFSNLIEVYVGRLRQKIDGAAPGAPSFLTTRRGEGYFVDDGARAGQ
jgi:two-component system, OmpR family, copper resistance phosphate regulon response regulator CusR